MRVVIRTAADITEREQQTCYALWDRAFPQDPGQTRPPDFAEPATVAILLDAAEPATGDTARVDLLVRDEVGTLIAACRLRERTIMVAGAATRVAGLASVAVVADQRGRGLGTRLVQLATDTARVHGYEWSVLFCSPPTQTFYQRLGWHPLAGDLRIGPPDEATPLDRAELSAMVLPLTRVAAQAGPTWHTAAITCADTW